MNKFDKEQKEVFSKVNKEIGLSDAKYPLLMILEPDLETIKIVKFYFK